MSLIRLNGSIGIINIQMVIKRFVNEKEISQNRAQKLVSVIRENVAFL